MDERAIRDLIKRHGWRVLEKPVLLHSNDFASLERRCGLELPDDFRDIYRILAEFEVSLVGELLYPKENVGVEFNVQPRAETGLCGVYLDYRDTIDTIQATYDLETKDPVWRSSMLPILYGGCGDYDCFDAESCTMFSFCHERRTFLELNETLDAWLLSEIPRVSGL